MWFGLACALTGCGDEARELDDEAPSAAGVAGSAGGGPTVEVLGPVIPPEGAVPGVEAMDLRVDGDGALLVYASGGQVLAARLDRAGVRVGEPRRVTALTGRVRALVAGASAGRVAVAWLRTAGGEAHVERALGAGRPAAFGPALSLERWPTSEAEASAQMGAQELALRVTPTGDFRLLHRATPMACDGGTSCASYRHSGLADDGSERRTSAALAARDVCPWALPGFVETSGRMYYGLCVLEDGAPRTTLYMLQPEPQYAQAEPALTECRPLGALSAPDPSGAAGATQALFAADCPEGRVAVGLGAPGVNVRPVGPITAPTCSAEGPTLLVGSITVALTAARDRLDGFLPAAVAPAGARVVWTGDAFLVAELVGSQLTVRRWACEATAAARPTLR